MASITIRNLDESIKSRLRVRAAHAGRSMEDEARIILRQVLTQDTAESPNLAVLIKSRFAGLGDV
jgi:antitoxin FitA